MRLNLWVTCSKCGAKGSIKYWPKGEVQPSVEDAMQERRKWEYVDCSLCKATNSLVLKKDGAKRLITVGVKKEGATFGRLRPVRTTRGKTTFGDFADANMIEQELGGKAELDDLEEDDPSDPTIKGGSSQVYKGTFGRLNATAYPASFDAAPPGLGALKNHALQIAAQIGTAKARGSQGMTMRAHYGDPGPLSKKVYLHKLFIRQGKTQKALSATLFAEFFLESDPTLKGVFDESDVHHTMEWCHALACSLGGDGSFKNLFSASYDANTFSAAIEDWLRHNRNNLDLFMWLNVHYQADSPDHTLVRTSCRRAPAFFTYCIAADAVKSKPISFYVDCRCIGFNRANYDDVHRRLNTHFGIKKADRIG